MSIKKVYQPIVELLQTTIANNPKAKITEVMDQVIAMASAKVSVGVGTTFLKDSAGNVVAIFDYYFKRWMPLVGANAVEFGKKANTATGFNTMSKEGVSHWTKQQREADNANKALIDRVVKGELQAGDIPAEQAKIEEARKAIVETTLGFATEDEVRAYLANEGVTLA